MAGTQLYESTYIIDPELEEETEQVTGQLQQVVESGGGEFVADRELGRRKLAYQINHRSEGIYRVMYFRGAGAVVNAVKNELGIMEPILRGIVVVANPDAIYEPSPAEGHVVAVEEQQAADGEEATTATEEVTSEQSEAETGTPVAVVEDEAPAEDVEPESVVDE